MQLGAERGVEDVLRDRAEELVQRFRVRRVEVLAKPTGGGRRREQYESRHLLVAEGPRDYDGGEDDEEGRVNQIIRCLAVARAARRGTAARVRNVAVSWLWVLLSSCILIGIIFYTCSIFHSLPLRFA